MEENELTNQYFAIVKRCGCLVGLWPYQTGWKRTFSRGCILFLFTTAVFTQISRIVLFYSFDILAEQIPFIGVAVAAITKYLNYIFHRSTFGRLIADMSTDWKSINTEEETTVLQMYAKRAMLFAVIYKMNMYFACVTFSFLAFVPRILDIIKPLNESRDYAYVYPAYYYLNDAKYYYIFMSHNVICMLAVVKGLQFCDYTMIYLVQHACSLLCVAAIRYKRAVVNIQRSLEKISDSPIDITYRKLCISVDTHNRAITLITEIESVYAINLFVQVGLAIIVFTTTLVSIAVKAFSPDMLPVYGFILVQLVHLLFLTIQGQFVIDSYESVYSEIYDALWYTTHHKMQIFYAVALRMSLTPPSLTAGGLIPLNLSSFAEIVKASVSYYTVLKSS